MEIRIADILRMKKKHPCGSFEWEVVRTGADIGLRCLGCDRVVFISRADITTKVREVIRK